MNWFYADSPKGNKIYGWLHILSIRWIWPKPDRLLMIKKEHSEMQLKQKVFQLLRRWNQRFKLWYLLCRICVPLAIFKGGYKFLMYLTNGNSMHFGMDNWIIKTNLWNKKFEEIKCHGHKKKIKLNNWLYC